MFNNKNSDVGSMFEGFAIAWGLDGHQSAGGEELLLFTLVFLVVFFLYFYLWCLLGFF